MNNKTLLRWRDSCARPLLAAVFLAANLWPAAKAATPTDAPLSDRLKINLGATPWKYMRSDKPNTTLAAKESVALPADPSLVTIDESAWQTVGIPRAVGQTDMFINMQSGGGQGQFSATPSARR